MHGLGRTPASLSRLQQHLVRADYWALSWGYPSHERIERHAEEIHDDLEQLDRDPIIGKIHLVTHSLGALLLRYALTLGVPEKLGRIVMLAPPNRGTPLAKMFLPILGSRWKSLETMLEDRGSLANQLELPEGLEIGIIAAKLDGKVPVESTHLDTETDHIVVPGFHTWIMNRKDVQRLVVQFLREGQFKEPGTE